MSWIKILKSWTDVLDHLKQNDDPQDRLNYLTCQNVKHSRKSNAHLKYIRSHKKHAHTPRARISHYDILNKFKLQKKTSNPKKNQVRVSLVTRTWKFLTNLYNFTINKIHTQIFSFHAFHTHKHFRDIPHHLHHIYMIFTTQFIIFWLFICLVFTWPFYLQNKAEKLYQPMFLLHFRYLHK